MIDIRSACITHTRTHTHSYLIPSFNFDDMVVISHCLNRFVVPPCQLLTSVPLYGDIYCLRFYLRLTDFLLVSISILFLRIFRLFSQEQRTIYGLLIGNNCLGKSGRGFVPLPQRSLISLTMLEFATVIFLNIGVESIDLSSSENFLYTRADS